MKLPLFFFSLAVVTLVATAALSQNETPAATPSQSGEQDVMDQMLALAKPGENHRVLGQLAGDWSYKAKFWFAPNAPANEASGQATRKPIMGGRYYLVEAKGISEMPGADGKMVKGEFTGNSIEAYDNAKGKFVSTWIDNMGTGIIISEGTYDAPSKTFTYHAQMEMMPGVKTDVREVIKITDQDHYTLEFFEQRKDQDVKTMEIDYTRQ